MINSLSKRTVGVLFLLIFCSQIYVHGMPVQGPARSKAIKVITYNLGLKVDYESENVFGTCRIKIMNQSATVVSHVPVLLYRLLTVTSISDEKGNSLPYKQKIVPLEGFEKKQVNHVDVSLPDPMDSNQSQELAISYQGYLLGLAETGMSYVKDHVDKKFTIIRTDCIAYPIICYPSLKSMQNLSHQNFEYTIYVTVPEDLVAANGGKLVSKHAVGGETTYIYKNIKPAWRMDVAIAPYRIIEDEKNKLKVFCFPKDEENAHMVIDAMNSALRLFAEWFGPVADFQGFTVIEIPEGYGSQTDVTSILQTADAFQKRDGLFSLYHEISHIWNVKALDPLPARFEAEGSAMLLQYLVQEKLDKEQDALKKGYERLRKRFRQQCEDNPKCMNVPIIDLGKEALTGLSYTKGMLFFYVLYNLLGEKDFLDAMGSFYQEYQQTGATSEEFLNHVRKLSKHNMDKLFKEWIYGTESSRLILEDVPLEKIIQRYLN